MAGMEGPPTAEAWIDATAGVAGDMLLGALLDAGAALPTVQAAVSRVVPGEVEVQARTVSRNGLRAVKADVRSTTQAHPHRSWPQIRAILVAAPLSPRVRDTAVAVFARLAAAEARVHGVRPDEVHFHEVGSWDSIGDIVGVCAALADLEVGTVTAGPVAVGSGRVDTAHGRLPVPTPAVLDLARGWQIRAGGEGELATPTGMALVRELARGCGPLPAMAVTAVGVGAGGRDVPGRANVVRVVLGTRVAEEPSASEMWVLETNVDDMDPRVWPSVLSALLDAGAADAWLVPVLMKKGRPGHTLCVLASDADRATLRAAVFALTTTLGVRETPVSRVALDRGWRTVPVSGGDVRVKVGLRDGRVVHATPEFEDVAGVARRAGLPARQVLDEAVAAAETAGLRPGEPFTQPGAAI